MVIDKTTGKGCAWRIASKTITKRLIAEGIMDKPFARKPFKSSYHLLSAEKFSDGQVIITLRRGSGSADEALWTPSFIEAGIWERGASRFRPLDCLDANVENYLLPEMGEYLQSINRFMPFLGEYKLTELRPEHFRKLYAELRTHRSQNTGLPISETTVEGVHACLCGISL